MQNVNLKHNNKQTKSKEKQIKIKMLKKQKIIKKIK